MKLTANIKLNLHATQSEALLRTLRLATAACDWISEQAFNNKVFKQFDLHKLVYKQAREKFALSAQMIVRCIAKVADSYKIQQTGKAEFSAFGAIAYDDRIISFKKNDAVSIWTVNGRLDIPFVMGARQRELFRFRKGEVDLIYRKGKFFLSCVCDVPDIALSMREDDVYGLNELGNLVIIYSGGSTPSWRPPLYYGVGLASRKLIAADFNADGKTDIGYLGNKSRGVFFNTTAWANTQFDFDGDGKTDISIFRPSAGEWWYSRSSNNQVTAAQFGNSSYKITPGDFTGDGKTDIAFWRPITRFWFVLRSEDGSFFAFPFGTNGDVPVVGDFDADGKADPGVFRPSTATWYISQSSGGIIIQQFGTDGDVPVVADYDGDGKADIAIFRPSAGEWWYQKSSNGQVSALQFGSSTDKAVPGDYTGDGKTDIAFFQPNTGFWYILRSEDFSFFAFPFGQAGDIPAPGDYDGDGKFDAAVFRPSTATWYVNRTTAGILITNFGASGDVPVPSAFIP